MKPNALLRYMMVALVLLSGLLSCSPTAPKRAEDETRNKRHDDPSVVSFRLTKGVLIDPKRWTDHPTMADVRWGSEVQEMTFSLTREGFLAHQDQGVTEFKVSSTASEANAVYLLEIFYKDEHGVPMNNQFIENGQDRIHQHFFRRYAETVSGGKMRVYPISNISELGYEYHYADVTPWDKPYSDPQSVFTGVTNPMGFKGLIRFTEKDLRFHLTVLLMHAHEPKSKIDPQTKITRFMPFYNNDAFTINQESDISIDVPISVDNGSRDERLSRYRR